MASRYLRATGNWNGPVWASTSGGVAGSAATPTASDDVYVIANFTATLTASASCSSLSFGSGRINLNSNHLDVKNSLYHSSSTTRTLDMTSGRLSVGVTEYYGLDLNATGLTVIATDSLIELNVSGTFSDSRATLATGSKTLSDVRINMGTSQYFAGLSETLSITGSPTFRLLDIRSANSAAHTVTFDTSAQVTADRLIAVGSSSSNRLSLNSATDLSDIFVTAGGSVYGQNVAIEDVYYESIASDTPAYIGLNSTDNTSTWLLQDPPKISTLVDPLTTAPGSNTNWTIDYGTPTPLSDGQAGGGYNLPSASITSTDTYDLVDSSIIFQHNAPSGGTLYFSYNLTPDVNGPAVKISTVNASFGNGFTAEYKNTRGTVSKASLSTGSFKASFVSISLDSSTNTLSFRAYYDGSWRTIHTTTIDEDDENLFRSGRVSVYGGGRLGSVGYSPAPVADFTASPTNAYNSSPVQFTNLTQGTGLTYLWDFGDGTTSTQTSPSKTYTVNGTYTVSLTATDANGSTTKTRTNYITVTTKQYQLDVEGTSSGGGDIDMFREYASMDLSGSSSGGGQVTFYTVFQPLPQKDYEYRIFDEDWNYIGTWANEVTSQFGYSQRINENASELMVSLARDPENRVVRYDYLQDENGSTILDENSDPIMVHTETPNAVGPGTDVRENLNVEVYAFYGGYDQLLDENSDPILDTDGEAILTQFGAPNGRRVYSGYISEYELTYGRETGVEVTIVPHATELSHYIFKYGSLTSVSYLNTDPVQMARDAMDNYTLQGGYITYTEASMPLSGQSTDYEFKLQTIREAVEKSNDLMPSGWYFYPHPGENTLYMREKSLEPDHMFYLGKHLTQLKLRRSISGLINEVYFTGGEYDPISNPDVDLLKYYSDTTSISTYRRGLDRPSDSRVTLASTAQILSEAKIASYKDPRYRTSVVITDAVYDIESIYLGDMVGFKNFGTFVDDLTLQIVAVQRNKHDVILDLDTVLTTQAKRLDTLKRQIEQEQIRNIPSQPV